MANDFFEKTLEEIIIQNKNVISQKGFPDLLDNTIAQFRLPSGKLIDIISFTISDGHISAKIFELKREIINADALCQVSDYASEFYLYCYPHFKSISIERFVIGTDVAKDAKALNDAQISIELYLYKYTINGIFFKHYESMYDCVHPDLIKTISEPTSGTCEFVSRLNTIDNENSPLRQN